MNTLNQYELLVGLPKKENVIFILTRFTEFTIDDQN